MSDLIPAYPYRHATIDGRDVNIHLFRTEIGDLYVVQYTLGGSHIGEIVDLYLGWSKEEATKKFERICSQIINGKK